MKRTSNTADDHGLAADVERAGLAPPGQRAARDDGPGDVVLDHLRATRAEDARDLAALRTRLEGRSRSRVRRRPWMLPAIGMAGGLLAALAAAWLPGTGQRVQPVTVAGDVSPQVLANIDFYQWLARQQRLERDAKRDLPIRHASQDGR